MLWKFAFLSLAALSASHQNLCPDDEIFDPLTSRCYAFYYGKTWDEALAACRGHLAPNMERMYRMVTVPGERKNDTLRRILEMSRAFAKSDRGYVWLGAYVGQKRLTWVDGPMEHIDGLVDIIFWELHYDKNCLALPLNAEGTLQLHHLDCNARHPVICSSPTMVIVHSDVQEGKEPCPTASYKVWYEFPQFACFTYTKPLSHSEALEECRKYGYDIVIPRHDQENKYVRELAESIGDTKHDNFWIGVYGDPDHWSRFYSLSRYQKQFSEWENESSVQEWSCGAMKKSNGKWITLDCSTRMPALCTTRFVIFVRASPTEEPQENGRKQCRDGFHFNEGNGLCYTFYAYNRRSVPEFITCAMGGSIADEEEDNFVRGITQYFDGSSISCPHSKNGKYFVGRIFNSAGNVKSWVDGSTANYINPKSVIDWKLGPNYIYIDGNGWSTAPTVDDACFYLCKEPASSTP